jgi:hypothetical protein
MRVFNDSTLKLPGNQNILSFQTLWIYFFFFDAFDFAAFPSVAGGVWALALSAGLLCRVYNDRMLPRNTPMDTELTCVG